MNDFDRTPPHDIAAEQRVLGGMLMTKDAVDDAMEVVTARDFYRGAHQIVFETAVRLYEAGEPVDAVTVANELTKTREISRIGGAAYLHTLIASVPSAANTGYYARIVGEKAILRRVIEAGTRIVQLGYGAVDGVADADEVVDRARAEVDDVTTIRPAVRDIEELTRTVLGSLETDAPVVPVIHTGLRDLDRLLNGVRGGQLVVVAARPAVGKSTLGFNIAANAAIRQKKRTRFHTLEMGAEELTMRLLAAEARVNLHSLFSHDLEDRQWDRLAVASGQLVDAPLDIDDTPAVSLGTIRAAQRRDPADFIVVDYLQLLAEPPKAENRQTAVAANARGLKLLAKESAVPLVVMAQLNRAPDHRADKRPLLSDLRESGEIEQSADIVILLHREDIYDRESPRAGEIDLIVAKHRNGPTATITAAFQGHFARIVDMARI